MTKIQELFADLESFFSKIEESNKEMTETIEMLKANNDILLKNTNELADQVKMLQGKVDNLRNRNMPLGGY
jgi:FtsZ-binding cell division protein ZapB